MALSVQFDLEDRDLEHFRKLMEDVCTHTDCADRERIVAEADALVSRLRAEDTPGYVLSRLDTLDMLITILRDREWNLPQQESDRVSYALAYFVNPQGLIPDETPSLGYLDDAIMIDLIAHDLCHEMAAYRDFCAFREAESTRREARGKGEDQVTRKDWLDAKRAELQGRMRRESSGLRSLFSLFS